ncbi:MAG: acylphosphatase [bacterium]|jgi:acylphosphatase
METVVRLRALVRGNVQGVGYRYWAHHTANRLGSVKGYVRNLPDGAVEVEAESNDKTVLQALFHELHVGPTAAQVTAVEANWEEEVPSRMTGSFRIA